MKMIKIGYLFLILGTVSWCVYFVSCRQKYVTEKNKIFYSLAKETGYLENIVGDTYDAVLSIPIIDLKKGLYKKGDSRNNIEENVTIHDMSDYPDKENSNLILMAHSGSGKIAFFNDLDKLNNDSLIEFYYSGIKYVYRITNYYMTDKTGFVSIKRDANKKTITLITCSQKDKSKHLIYIGYIIDEVEF